MKRVLGRACLVIGAIVVGCGGDDDPKVGNGVDDVQQACSIRTAWNRTGNDCSVCEAAVITPRCDCSSLAAYSAACSAQQDARAAVCPASLDTCLNACVRDDCACTMMCYASVDAACKKASDARDGCIASACNPYCK